MLYTFANNTISDVALTRHLSHITAEDTILLWQNGTLLLLDKYNIFAQHNNCIYILEQDLIARNLIDLYLDRYQIPNHKFVYVTVIDFIKLTERSYPQIAL